MYSAEYAKELELNNARLIKVSKRWERLYRESEAAFNHARDEVDRLSTQLAYAEDALKGLVAVNAEYCLKADRDALKSSMLPAEKLLAIADWLDTFDAITELWLQGKLPAADTSDIEEALASVRAKDIQNELRAAAVVAIGGQENDG